MVFSAFFAILSVLVSAWTAGGALTREEPAISPNTWSGTREADPKREGKATVTPAKDFDPEKDAVRLYKAMRGIGTDEQELINVLAYRSLDQRRIISKTFTKKYNYDFERWLYSELSGWFKSTIQGMMNPDRMLARDLRWAMEGGLPDFQTLIDILVPMTIEELRRVKDYYQSYYDTSLRDYILDKIDFKTERSQKLFKLLIDGRPSSWAGGKKKELDREMAKKSAKIMYNEGGVLNRSNEDNLHHILTQTSREQLKLTLEEFRLLAGKSFEEVVNDGPEPWFYREYIWALQSIALWAADPEDYFMMCLFFGMTTYELSSGSYERMDERILRRITVWRAEIDLNAIKILFQEMGYDIADVCEDIWQPDFGKTILALWRS